jgi:hydroxyethylthiazole kinase-like sugar kinase family protein
MSNANQFTAKSEVAAAYIAAKYSSAGKDQWKAVAALALSAARQMQSAMESIYANGPKIHGTFQASQLDLLSKWKSEMLAAMTNAEAAAMAAA